MSQNNTKNKCRQSSGYAASLILGISCLLTLVEPAFAHAEDEGGVGFLTGLFHPALGLDHLLAMLSVGILSAQIGGRAIWYVPATFVLVMIVGGIMGMKGIALPFVEAGIAISVLVLGIALAAEKYIPVWVAVVSVGIFGVFHGHAHGTEMPMIANPWLYGMGFVTGTAIIHLVGVYVGFGFKRLQRGPGMLRAVGLGIACVGCYFLIRA